MKKFIFLFIPVMFSLLCSAQSGVALASKQTDQIVRADTANARLLRTIAATKANSVTTSSFSQSTLTSVPSSATTSGTVTAGAKGVLFETSSDFVGTIDGLLFQANGFLSLPVSPGTNWPAIPYTVTSGTLYIRKFN